MVATMPRSLWLCLLRDRMGDYGEPGFDAGNRHRLHGGGTIRASRPLKLRASFRLDRRPGQLNRRFALGYSEAAVIRFLGFLHLQPAATWDSPASSFGGGTGRRRGTPG